VRYNEQRVKDEKKQDRQTVLKAMYCNPQYHAHKKSTKKPRDFNL